MTKGDRIRSLRDAKGLSQEELAKKLNISKQAIGKYEKNIVTNIPSDRLEEMAVILGTTPEYIMGWKEDPEDRAAFDVMVAKDNELRSMIKMYMALPEDKKRTIKQMIEDYFNAYA